MGYRSNLMVLVYPDACSSEEEQEAKYDQLKVLMGAAFKNVVEEFEGYMTWMDSDCVLKFELEDVKWYPSYPDVRMFEDMLRAFKGYDDTEDIKGYCTEFVRIGEDSNDVEEVHTGDNNHYYLQVRRTIDCNV